MQKLDIQESILALHELMNDSDITFYQNVDRNKPIVSIKNNQNELIEFSEQELSLFANDLGVTLHHDNRGYFFDDRASLSKPYKTKEALFLATIEHIVKTYT